MSEKAKGAFAETLGREKPSRIKYILILSDHQAYADTVEALINTTSEIASLTPGSYRPSEIPVATEGESMDQIPGPSREQGTIEPPEATEEELVLPHLHVRYRDRIPSEVRVYVFRDMFSTN